MNGNGETNIKNNASDKDGNARQTATETGHMGPREVVRAALHSMTPCGVPAEAVAAAGVPSAEAPFTSTTKVNPKAPSSEQSPLHPLS